MSRESDIYVVGGQIAAAAAGTDAIYCPVPVASRWVGFYWGYQAAEANADNTLDFVIGADTEGDGTFDGQVLFTNSNANGLLDSAAIGEILINFGNAASGGAAAIAVDVTEARVAAGATIRLNLTTAGTGTVPAINAGVILKALAPLD